MSTNDIGTKINIIRGTTHIFEEKNFALFAYIHTRRNDNGNAPRQSLLENVRSALGSPFTEVLRTASHQTQFSLPFRDRYFSSS